MTRNNQTTEVVTIAQERRRRFVKSADGKVKVLCDPGGSYKQATKGSGDALYGKDANLDGFVKYQQVDGQRLKPSRSRRRKRRMK